MRERAILISPQKLKFMRRASDYSYYHVGGRRPDGESARVF